MGMSLREAVTDAVEILSMLHLNGTVVTKDNDSLSEIIHTLNCYLDECPDD